MKTGRNDPCPCGSGKKYKHCHLLQQVRGTVEESDVIAAQRKAHAWLDARFGNPIKQQITQEFLALMLDDADEDDALQCFLDDLDEGAESILDIGLNDWALCETVYERRGKFARGIDRVLQARDAGLTTSQHAFLESVARAPLRLYEVRGVERDRGLWLRDLLAAARPAIFVHEISATHGATADHLLGMRVIHHNDRDELGGIIYPLTAVSALDILREMRLLFGPQEDAVQPADVGVTHEEHHDRVLATLIRDSWLHDRVESLDARTSPVTPISFAVDEYDVSDSDALDVALGGCADLEGFPETGNWVRLTDPGDEVTAGVIIAREPDETGAVCRERIVARHLDMNAADANRTWFDGIASANVQHRKRRREVLGGGDFYGVPTTALGTDATLVPDAPDAHTAHTQHRYESDYAQWCDSPSRALGDREPRTPRSMLANAADRDRVELLLRIYDDLEARFAIWENRAAASFDFLRRQWACTGRPDRAAT